MSGRELYVARLKLKQHRWELGKLLNGEDVYRDLYHGILRGDLHLSEEQIAEQYGHWHAFCGGGRELIQAVSAAAEAVHQAAGHTGAEAPDFYAGPWPGTGLNASARATDYGNVVYIDAPLIFTIRGFVQQVVSCLREIEAGVNDGPIGERARHELGRMWSQHQLGEDVRGAFPVRAWRDPDLERVRRNMIWGALCYTVAHEVGHLARCRPWRGAWKADNREFQVHTLIDEDGNLHPPQTEADATDAHASELGADLIACAALRHEDFFVSSGDEGKLSFIVGAMSVPQLQAAAWWRRAAATDAPLGWTHPAWDLRRELVRSELSRPEGAQSVDSPDIDVARAAAAREPTQLEMQTDHASDFLQRLLDVPDARARALERGLSNRGLNPEALVSLQVVYGAGMENGSDVVRGLRRGSAANPSTQEPGETR
jgi:hypothetical protein